jgi:hypothetical protein
VTYSTFLIYHDSPSNFEASNETKAIAVLGTEFTSRSLRFKCARLEQDLAHDIIALFYEKASRFGGYKVVTFKAFNENQSSDEVKFFKSFIIIRHDLQCSPLTGLDPQTPDSSSLSQ